MGGGGCLASYDLGRGQQDAHLLLTRGPKSVRATRDDVSIGIGAEISRVSPRSKLGTSRWLLIGTDPAGHLGQSCTNIAKTFAWEFTTKR